MTRTLTTRSVRAYGAALLLLVGPGCNQRHPPAENPVAPSPPLTTIPAPIGPVPVTLSGLILTPEALLGGSAGRGAVLLTDAAPAGGMAIALSSDDPAVTVPSSVTVPAGRDSADFAVTTRVVPADHQASIVGSVPERTATVNLALWSVEPTFFSFTNEGPIFSGVEAARRVLPPSATFTGFCTLGQLDISIRQGSRDSWSVRISAPQGRPLSVGTYDVIPLSVSGAQLSLGGTGLGCSQGYGGRFTVREASYQATGVVNRFWATFDLRCAGTAPPTRGDLRLADIAAPFVTTCKVP